MRWCAVILFLAWFSIGCGPSALSFFLMPWIDDKADPQCKIADKEKEVTVAIMTSFANSDIRPDNMTVDRELSDRLERALRDSYEKNKEKVKVVPTVKVQGVLNRQTKDVPMSLPEIGKQLKADYVISLELTKFDTYKYGSMNTLYLGNTEININVVKVGAPAGEGNVFQEIYQNEYPATGPIDTHDESPVHFRTKFVNRVVRDLTKYFDAYPNDRKADVD